MPEPLLRDAFSAVAATLTELHITLLRGPVVADLWSPIGVLSGLMSLSVDLGSGDADLNFSCLPSMLRLNKLFLQLVEVGCARQRKWRPSRTAAGR